jgi:hypothetical protein
MVGKRLKAYKIENNFVLHQSTSACRLIACFCNLKVSSAISCRDAYGFLLC